MSSTTSMSRVLQDSTLYLVGNVAVRAIGFLAIPFYSRFLSPAQYGLIELVELSTQTIAIAFGLQTIGVALSRLYHDQPNAERERAVVSTSLIGTAALSLFVTIIAVALSTPLSQLVFHTSEWATLLQASFIAMFFSSSMEVVLVYERIRNNARFFLIYTLITLVLTLSLNILFIGVMGFGVWGFVSSKLIVTTSATIYLAFRMRRDVGWHWEWPFIPGLVRFGAPLVLSTLSYFAIHFSDRFFLSAAVSLADLGRYALAYKFAILVSALVGDSFNKSWSVTLYRYLDRNDWRDQFARVASYLTFILFATGLAIALFSPELLRIMVPPDYLPPPMLLPILIASYLAREIGDFFRSLLLINKRSGMVGKIAAAGAILNLAANALLIPKFGIYGAAASTLATWVAYMVACWAIANAEHKLPVNPLNYLRIALVCAVVYILGAQTRGSGYVVQVLLDGLWVLVFSALAIRLFLSPQERQGALAMVGNLFLHLFETALGPATLPHAQRRVLLIAFHYPPRNEIGAARPHRFARHLRRSGTPVTVVTIPEPPDAPNGQSDDEPFLLRVPEPPQPRQHRTRIATWSIRGTAAALGVFERIILPYDDRAWWFPHAYEAARRLAGPGTVLLSTHPPTVTHAVALAVKNQRGTPWIADFRDPLWGNPYRTANRASLMDPLLERLIIENADAVIANTEASAALLRTRYPAHGAKVQVIWNGFEAEDVLAPTPPPTRTRRIIAHVGTLYGNRTALPFIASLDRLIAQNAVDPATIAFRQVGRADPSCLNTSAPAMERLIDLGCCEMNNRNIPAKDARLEMLDAQWLLLLDMNLVNPGLQVPAKLYEYVRTGRPILALTVPGSSTEYVLTLAGVTHRCVDLNLEAEAFDAAVLDFLAVPTTVTTPSAAFLDAFEASGQVRHLNAIIDQVCQPHDTGAQAPPPA